MRDPTIAQLRSLLEAETTAILAGQYAVLDDLAARKDQLFDDLQQAPRTATDLRAISGLLTRNQALLAAALKGISAARLRLTALKAVRDGLQVYDQSGRFAASPVARPDLVRKA
ncbi:flagellar protein FlgN [Yoonia vestfoldensis]|uniref:FlgN-like protein n=1 Tax=Yoonia vestfoldensis TaxID=245188 RepID=A0A1Y0EGN8_9RHOB|nr:flagellar protein FlgN [Yoonia vestfoldensis]ARU02599.1 FlgN-like protein [Yoonia vestfoldensis]